MMLKRSLFCGITLCLGSLQYLTSKNPATPLFLILFMIGMAQCILSVYYQHKFRSILLILLSTEALYYLSCFIYILFELTDHSLKFFGGFTAAGMLAIVVSAILTLWRAKT